MSHERFVYARHRPTRPGCMMVRSHLQFRYEHGHPDRKENKVYIFDMTEWPVPVTRISYRVYYKLRIATAVKLEELQTTASLHKQRNTQHHHQNSLHEPLRLCKHQPLKGGRMKLLSTWCRYCNSNYYWHSDILRYQEKWRPHHKRPLPHHDLNMWTHNASGGNKYPHRQRSCTHYFILTTQLWASLSWRLNCCQACTRGQTLIDKQWFVVASVNQDSVQSRRRRFNLLWKGTVSLCSVNGYMMFLVSQISNLLHCVRVYL